MSLQLEGIPEHLHPYITHQDTTLYTAMDQAAWRYIMAVSKKFFASTAHFLYQKGIEATGISTQRIPFIFEMDNALKPMGWRAVPINGFIPPSVFLEFQSQRILAIACDMRKIENLGYTPSPDIVHEAAGHAPMVADPGYRAFLEAYGEIARKAILSSYDNELYECIRVLSEVKENPKSTPEEIARAQEAFEKKSSEKTEPSEAALLTRMAWWTTEYGLIGSVDHPKIFGAGLLSSVSESYHCLSNAVPKIPFSLKAVIQTPYDITKPQPQLFVARDFQQLIAALHEFSLRMAYRKGGAYGLDVALDSQTTVTIEFDSGIQMTGTVTDFDTEDLDGQEHPTFIVIENEKQLSFLDQAVDEYPYYQFPETLVIPLFDRKIGAASNEDLERKVHTTGLPARGGIRVKGQVAKTLSIQGRGRMMLLEKAIILNSEDQVIFSGKDKLFPLILSHSVTSVFGGAADRREFFLRPRAQKKDLKIRTHKTNLTAENAILNTLYSRVRDIREQNIKDVALLEQIYLELNHTSRTDWLLRLELLELLNRLNPKGIISQEVRNQLISLREHSEENKEMIDRGFEVYL